MRKQVKISELISHPQNDFFFDRMEESKWNDFKESIKNNGLFEAPIVTPENLIVSGHERIRACKELGLREIEVEVREFVNDEEVLTCLIETNIQQRGSIGGSVIKMARRIQALERCYGIRHGNNSKFGGQEIISAPKTQEQLASELGMTARNMRMIKNLADLPEGFQEMVDSGKITATAAAKLIVGLTSKEKEELLEYLTEHDDSIKRFTEGQIAEYIGAIQACETRLRDYQELSTGDNEDYVRLVEEKERIKSEAMKSLSELTHAQRQLRDVKKDLADAQKRASQYDQVKQELAQAQGELLRIKEHGTTVVQVINSLSGLQSVANGLADAEISGKIGARESEKIIGLMKKIEESLGRIRDMVLQVNAEKIA